MLSLPFLPQDVITSILLRLPIKTIGRFRCISKPWLCLLTSPGFIKDHLKLHMCDPEDLVFTVGLSGSSSPYILTFTTGNSGDDAISKKVDFPFERKPFTAVGNSCNGLVLIVEHNIECCKYLMNPVTLEAIEVPGLPLAMFSSCGLGYDCSSDDYKIVSLSSNSKCVDIYSLKENTWRKIGDFSNAVVETHFHPYSPPGVFINGYLHWVVYDSSTSWTIVSFNLAREEFEEVVPFPNGAQYHVGATLEIICLGGCLALVYRLSDSSPIDVWMMKDYGVRDSWTKLTIINYPDCEFRVLCLLGEDEIVLEKCCGSKLVAYNRRNGVWRDLVVSGIYDELICLLMPFRGSLVSPVVKRIS